MGLCRVAASSLQSSRYSERKRGVGAKSGEDVKVSRLAMQVRIENVGER